MTGSNPRPRRVVALAGGVGEARLIDGLHQALPRDALTAVVNTGDDFTHWGLKISPDLDTVMYTLAGLAPEDRGWGIDGDTFSVLDEARRRGDEAWFRLGDRDLATHLYRTRRLTEGALLTEITAELCEGLGVATAVLPMTDQPSPTTVVDSDGRRIAFQNWLVRERAGPAVARIEVEGSAAPSSAVSDAIEAADLVVIGPSNPYVSIDPILSLEGVTEMVGRKPVIAVSPILRGKAVKGPLATMIEQLEGTSATAQSVAQHYDELVNGFITHHGDGFDAPYPVMEANILVPSGPDRLRLARELLEFATEIT